MHIMNHNKIVELEQGKIRNQDWEGNTSIKIEHKEDPSPTRAQKYPNKNMKVKNKLSHP